MTKKQSNTPRHKKLNRESRLQAAKHWLPNYNGKNKVRGYNKHFAVDLLCAANELRMLGVQVEEKYIKQLQIDRENRTENSNLRRERRQLDNQIEQDNDLFFIAGYTDNGAPYGVAWDEISNEADTEIN
jgi:hypothetical protein